MPRQLTAWPTPAHEKRGFIELCRVKWHAPIDPARAPPSAGPITAQDIYLHIQITFADNGIVHATNTYIYVHTQIALHTHLLYRQERRRAPGQSRLRINIEKKDARNYWYGSGGHYRYLCTHAYCLTNCITNAPIEPARAPPSTGPITVKLK